MGAVPGRRGARRTHDFRPVVVNSTVTGREAERTAEHYLREKGFRLVQRNFRARTGEIDLIMEQGSLLAFIEVRFRANPNYGSGADSMSRSKQQKIINKP